MPPAARVAVQDTSRIVSIGGAVTEILYALGMDDKIVAIDTTSLYPTRAAKEKKNVGYMRQLSPEGVLGLAPTLMLAIEGAGPKETMTVLAAAKVPLVVVPDHYTGRGHRREGPPGGGGDRSLRPRPMPGQAGRGRSRCAA